MEGKTTNSFVAEVSKFSMLRSFQTLDAGSGKHEVASLHLKTLHVPSSRLASCHTQAAVSLSLYRWEQ